MKNFMIVLISCVAIARPLFSKGNFESDVFEIFDPT